MSRVYHHIWIPRHKFGILSFLVNPVFRTNLPSNQGSQKLLIKYSFHLPHRRRVGVKVGLKVLLRITCTPSMGREETPDQHHALKIIWRHALDVPLNKPCPFRAVPHVLYRILIGEYLWVVLYWEVGSASGFFFSIDQRPSLRCRISFSERLSNFSSTSHWKMNRSFLPLKTLPFSFP